MTISTWARDTIPLGRGASEFCAPFGNNRKCRRPRTPLVHLSASHPRYIGQTLVDHQPPLPGKSHIFISTLGSAWEPQNSVAPSEKPIRDWIQNLVVDSVSRAERS